MFLYIVRHGEPDYSTDSLLPRGAAQAESVAKRLFDAGVSRVFTSPLGRAKQSAEPLCRLLNTEYTIEEWTREIPVQTTLPDGSTQPFAAVQYTRFREPDMTNSMTDDTMAACALIEKNGNAFLEKLGYRYEDNNYRILQPNEEKVVLFCHGNFARVWLGSLLKIPPLTMMAAFGYNHTGVTILHFQNNENGLTAPRCLTYSDISHLYAHGPDTLYNGNDKI